ncbi:FHA domain-containing protein [Trinickia mobilis]|uniref:FHA domain-containing protein n=1 Tax=Trinickia mobilis TaxID=2816356 RepID=UPI001A8FBE35|nr:FHA domain-containing protein [Trinickia mobilis]
MLELRVLNGLHRGATLPIDASSVRIGSDADNDLVLLDPGIEPHHATLVCDEPGALRWSLCNAGEPAPLPAGAPVDLGGVYLVVVAEDAPWSAPAARPSAAEPANGARAPYALAASAVAALLLVAGIGALAYAKTTPASRTLLPVPAPRAAEARTAGDAACAQKLRAQLRAIDERLTLVAAPGDWRIEGELDGSAETRLDAALAAFRAQACRLPPLQFMYRIAAAPSPASLPFALAQIQAGAEPFIVTDSGVRLYPGSSFMGMTVDRIDERAVVFAGHPPIVVPW